MADQDKLGKISEDGMPDEAWKTRVDALSLEFMADALRKTDSDPLQAVAALCMAAARAAGAAGIPFETAMELFMRQYQMMRKRIEDTAPPDPNAN